MAEFQRLALDEGLQAGRQIISLRQYRSINQYGHYPDISLQCCFNFDANKIVRIVDSPSSLAISNSRPVSANEREQNVISRHSLYNCSEVDADVNGVNVHEDTVFTETLTETII